MRAALPLGGIAALLMALSAQAQQGAQPATPTQPPAPSLEQRVSAMERVVNGQALTDLLFQLQQLQQDVQNLRGQLEEQNHTLEGIKQRQRDLYLDMDRRMQRLEVSGGAPKTASKPTSSQGTKPPSSTSTLGSAPATPAGDPAKELENYQAAFKLLRQGRFAQAAQAFETFLAQYPQGTYAGNAQYWLGETHYGRRQFAQAIAEYQKVVNQYPDSNKVADARLKIGYAHYEMQQWAEARQALALVREQHPNATAARLAAKRLQKMTEEGH